MICYYCDAAARDYVAMATTQTSWFILVWYYYENLSIKDTERTTFL